MGLVRTAILTMGLTTMGCTSNAPQKTGDETTATTKAAAPSKEAPSKETGAPSPVVVATVGKRKITTDDLRQRLRELSPKLQQQYLASKHQRRALLEKVIEEEMLITVARERGYHQDPRLKRLIRLELIRNVKNDVERLATFEGISDQQAKAYFEKNLKRFSRGKNGPTFMQVKTTVKVAMLREQRAALNLRFLRELRQKIPVTRDFSLLELLKPEPSANGKVRP